MRYQEIPQSLFVKNQEKVLAKLPEYSSAVVFSNPQMPKNGDEYYTYRQSSDFFYLTGICQEKSILILSNCNGTNQKILFILEQKPELEQWEGQKLRNADATAISGITEIHFVEEFEEIWNEFAQKSYHLFYSQNRNPRLKTDLQLPNEIFGTQLTEKWQWKDIQCLDKIMTECRLIKEPEEIDLIQRASDITKESFFEILSAAKPGMYEYELEAIMTNCFLRNGANGHAFDPIISNGKNTCYLHYVKNDQKLIAGNCVQLDFGSEYANYASDCSRVFPINGKFSKRQKEYYNAVLRVFKEIRNIIRPGMTIFDYQKITCQLIQDELLTLGLLSKDDIKNDTAYYKYFMHGISHFIGLDTHDVGEKTEILKPGMIVSCEPGIYAFEEEMGMRLENTILITESGCRDLMNEIPIELEEIENLMK